MPSVPAVVNTFPDRRTSRLPDRPGARLATPDIAALWISLYETAAVGEITYEGRATLSRAQGSQWRAIASEAGEVYLDMGRPPGPPEIVRDRVTSRMVPAVKIMTSRGPLRTVSLYGHRAALVGADLKDAGISWRFSRDKPTPNSSFPNFTLWRLRPRAPVYHATGILDSGYGVFNDAYNTAYACELDSDAFRAIEMALARPLHEGMLTPQPSRMRP